MALHKDLTGTELHEPKGVASATAGTVYVSNGSGSGNWTPLYGGVLNLNKYSLSSQMTDISTANDKVYFYIPYKSQMTSIAAVLYGPISTANAVLSVYVNGVLFADSLTVTQSGSSAGQVHQVNFTTANTISAGSVVEVRTDGASDTTARAEISLNLEVIS